MMKEKMMTCVLYEHSMLLILLCASSSWRLLILFMYKNIYLYLLMKTLFKLAYVDISVTSSAAAALALSRNMS